MPQPDGLIGAGSSGQLLGRAVVERSMEDLRRHLGQERPDLVGIEPGRDVVDDAPIVRTERVVRSSLGPRRGGQDQGPEAQRIRIQQPVRILVRLPHDNAHLVRRRERPEVAAHLARVGADFSELSRILLGFHLMGGKPAVRVPRRQPQGPGAVGGQPDGGEGPAVRPQSHDGPVQTEVLALEGHVVPRVPQEADQIEGLLEPRDLARVGETVGLDVLPFSGSDPQDEPPPRQVVQ